MLSGIIVSTLQVLKFCSCDHIYAGVSGFFFWWGGQEVGIKSQHEI